MTDLLRALRDKHGDTLLLGVGTVLDESQAREALVAGADFLVSPALATEAVDMAHAAGALCLLGAFTPTEAAAARGRGYGEDLPADTGGPKHLAALKSVYPDTVFCPTGGVTVDNMGAYFAAGASIVGIGSNLYDKAAFAARDTAALVKQIIHPRGRPCLISISSPWANPWSNSTRPAPASRNTSRASAATPPTPSSPPPARARAAPT